MRALYEAHEYGMGGTDATYPRSMMTASERAFTTKNGVPVAFGILTPFITIMDRFHTFAIPYISTLPFLLLLPTSGPCGIGSSETYRSQANSSNRSRC